VTGGNEAEIVARLRTIYEAFNRGDYDALVDRVDVDDMFEVHRVGGLGVLRGKKAVREWMEPDAIEDARFEPVDVEVNGDKVFVRARTRGRGASSGIAIEGEAYSVWTMDEDGIFVRAENFTPSERAEALRAAGLEDRG
jgi:ketosteroid isomerase-like protein